MVEHAAPGRKHRQRQTAPVFLAPLAADDGGAISAVPHPVDGPHTDRHPGTAGAQSDAGGRSHEFRYGPYAGYIWPAYGVTVLVLGGVTLWTLAAWRRAKARLAALEASQSSHEPLGLPSCPSRLSRCWHFFCSKACGRRAPDVIPSVSDQQARAAPGAARTGCTELRLHARGSKPPVMSVWSMSLPPGARLAAWRPFN